MLDRNSLMALYAPVSTGSGALLASRGNPSRGRGNSAITIARGQSPDAAEPDRPAGRPGDVTVPPPELVIKSPLTTRRTSAGAEGSTRRMAWQPTHPTPAPKLTTTDPPGKTEKQTDLNLDPQADHDQFSHFEPDKPGLEQNANAEDLPKSPPSAAGSPARNRAGDPSSHRPSCNPRIPRRTEHGVFSARMVTGRSLSRPFLSE